MGSLHTYQRKIKTYWPNFPLHIGQYSLFNKRHVEKEAEVIKEIFLCTGNKKGHDPQNIIYKHIKAIKIAQQIVHEFNYVEDTFRGALNFEEVLDRILNELDKQQIHKDEDADIIFTLTE